MSPLEVAVLLVALDQTPAKLQGFDALVPEGWPVILEAKLERKGILGINPDLHGIEVVFARGDREIARARTAGDGMARVAWTPPEAGEYEIAVRVADPARFEAPPAALRVFSRDPKERETLVVDLDGTVCASSGLDVARKEPAKIEATPGSAEALRRLARRFDVVYLTARDDALADKTRRWLDLRGFPRGPVLVRDVSFATLSAEKWKTARLADLARDFRLAAGVGDRDEDARAYVAAGMDAILVGGASDAPEKARRAADWTEVERLLQR